MAGKISSTSEHTGDDAAELETHFLLRLPTDYAYKLYDMLREGAGNLQQTLKLQFDADMRHGTVTFNDETLHAKLMDLPCIVEALKTLDKKNFYKSGEISQILVCDTPGSSSVEESAEKSQKHEKKYHLNHGLTPPLKNVRHRRFRKTLRKKFMDAPDIERELKRLLRADLEAESVRWELVSEDNKSKRALNLETPAASSNTALLFGSGEDAAQSVDVLGEHELFGSSISSSSDEEGSPKGADDSLMGVPSRSVEAASESRDSVDVLMMD